MKKCMNYEYNVNKMKNIKNKYNFKDKSLEEIKIRQKILINHFSNDSYGILGELKCNNDFIIKTVEEFRYYNMFYDDFIKELAK